MDKRVAVIIIALVFIVIISFVVFHSEGPPKLSSGAILVVATENFYGNIAEQLGGPHVSVTSILSDPNVDPHEYESTVKDGIAVADTAIVVENGLSYDTWMDKLISASPNPNRILITAGDIAPDLLPDNPHVWYGIDNISAVAHAITAALLKIDPADAVDFENNLAAFDGSLTPLRETLDGIKEKYSGTPVGLTETIYLYQTKPMGLDVLTPLDFEKAIAEGNDPSAQSVASADGQVNGKQIKVLLYNSQTVTPVTTNLENAAGQQGIPIVPITETMPSGVTYQRWMMDEMNALEQALAASTGR